MLRSMLHCWYQPLLHQDAEPMRIPDHCLNMEGPSRWIIQLLGASFGLRFSGPYLWENKSETKRNYSHCCCVFQPHHVVPLFLCPFLPKWEKTFKDFDWLPLTPSTLFPSTIIMSESICTTSSVKEILSIIW